MIIHTDNIVDIPINGISLDLNIFFDYIPYDNINILLFKQFNHDAVSISTQNFYFDRVKK